MSIAGDLIRGHTDAIILARLLQSDSYGYEINKTISTLSSGQFELKEATLYTAFKRHGSTPNQTRQKLLVKQAKQLLTTTDSSVQTISDQLGFSSSSYFRKILRRYTGKTPMQIRKAGAKV